MKVELNVEDLKRMEDYLEGYSSALYIMKDTLPAELVEDSDRTIRRLDSFRTYIRAVRTQNG